MNYYLMQQNNGIANIDINIQTGRIAQINEIYSFERLPVFTTENNFNELKDSLNKWISHRSISKSRKDLPQILQDNHVRTPEALALKTLGLSLSDQYWFRPENTMYNWLNVNLYDNNFKQMKLLNTAESNLSASDSTLNGQLTKYWKIENDTRYLFKQSTKERRKREIEPVIDFLDSLSNIDDKSDEAKEFGKLLNDLSSVSTKINNIMDLAIKSDEHWLVGKITNLMKQSVRFF